jgi:hypothetical protein
LLLKRALNHPKFKLWFFFGVSLFVHLALIFNWRYSSPKVETQADPIVVKLIDIATVSLSNKVIEPQASKTEEAPLVAEPVKEEQSSTIKSSGQPFLLPPSAQLRYATLVNDNPNQDANIIWQQDGSSYSLDVKFWILFVGEIFFKSSGKIDEYGISPDNYSEKVGKRNRAVEFNRAKQELFFTSNKTVMSLPLGVQDRFSVIFQLAALVTGNPDIDLEGVARKIPIADVSRLDDWVFISQGDVEIPDQQLEKPILTRHFLRSARGENDRRRLEVWLAKDLDWLPIRIKQTEPNGTTYDMNLVQHHAGKP